MKTFIFIGSFFFVLRSAGNIFEIDAYVYTRSNSNFTTKCTEKKISNRTAKFPTWPRILYIRWRKLLKPIAYTRIVFVLIVHLKLNPQLRNTHTVCRLMWKILRERLTELVCRNRQPNSLTFTEIEYNFSFFFFNDT